MSENKAISCNEDANESEDETEGADEVSEDCEDEDEDHASTIQADVEDDSESLDPRIQVSKSFYPFKFYVLISNGSRRLNNGIYFHKNIEAKRFFVVTKVL